MQAVGVYLAALRAGRGIGQDELAEHLDISVRTIRNIEHGTHPPRSDYLLEVARVLGASMAHIARLAQPSATEALARALANVQLSGQTLSDEELYRLEEMSPDQLRAVIALAQQMRR